MRMARFEQGRGVGGPGLAGDLSNAELFEEPIVISRRRRSWRRWWRRIHLTVGLTAGVLVAVVFATGSVLVATFSVDRWVNPDVHQRTSPATAAPAPLEEVVRSARRYAPAAWGRPERVSAPGLTTYGADNTYEVRFLPPDGCLPRCPTKALGSTYDLKLHYVYVDPGSGRVQSARSAPSGHFSVFMYELHAELFSGSTGLWIVGGAGLVMLFSAITGLVLWWPLGRHGVGFKIRRRPGTARLTYDLHNAVGFYVSLGLLVLAVTGLIRTATVLPPFDTAVDKLIGSTVDVSSAAALPPPSARRIPLDRAVQIAQRAIPDGRLAAVRLPDLGDEGDRYDGRRAVGAYQVIFAPPNLASGVKSDAIVFVEPWTGRVLGVDDTRSDSVPQQIIHQWAADIHDGSAGGPVGRVVAFILGLLPAGLLITGWMMWRARRRTGRRSRPAATG